MKIRILITVVTVLIFIWSCDEPVAYDNGAFVYNPFSFQQDTIHSIESIDTARAAIEWGGHFRAWIGETQKFKSGISAEFNFSGLDTSRGIPDSVRFQIRHFKTYPDTGGTSLPSSTGLFGYYETTDQSIDIVSNSYGDPIGVDTLKISGGDDYWGYTLPDDRISEVDTVISLGLFPEEAGYLASIYGGGSVSRPALSFYYSEPDTANPDSMVVSTHTFLSDTTYMHIIEKAEAFDRSQFHYLSQMAKDSLVLNVNVSELMNSGDTLQHVISSSIIFAVDSAASDIHMPDSTFKFNMLITEPVSNLSFELELGANGINRINQIKYMIQAAVDDDREQVELIINPTNPGYNPGFIAISQDASESALSYSISKAVRP